MPDSLPDSLIHTSEESYEVNIVVSETQKTQKLILAHTAISGRTDIGA